MPRTVFCAKLQKELPALDEIGAVVAGVAGLVPVSGRHSGDTSLVLAALDFHDARHEEVLAGTHVHVTGER